MNQKCLFNEDSLRRGIIEIWGEYGAHCEVFDTLCSSLRHLEAQNRRYGEALGEIVENDRHHEECLSGKGEAVCHTDCPYGIAKSALKDTNE